MLAAPVHPVGCVSGRSGRCGGAGDQVLGLGGGERDQAGIGGRELVGVCGFGGLAVGAVAQ